MADLQGDEAATGSQEEEPQEAGEDRVELDDDALDDDPAAIIIDTVETMARAMVDHPDEVECVEVPSDRGPRFHLNVHPDDLGRVIGRGGHMARAIRQVARAAAALEDMSIFLEIGD